MRVTAGDYDNESFFILHDDDVRMLAPHTCKLLTETDEGSTLYPDEMDLLFADPMIFEVTKLSSDSSYGSGSYDVHRVFTHPHMFDVFLNPYFYSSPVIAEMNLSGFDHAGMYDHSEIEHGISIQCDGSPDHEELSILDDSSSPLKVRSEPNNHKKRKCVEGYVQGDDHGFPICGMVGKARHV